MDLLKGVIEYGAQILQSQVATQLLLLAAFVLLAGYTRRNLDRNRTELKAALIECKRDGVVDAGLLQSAMTIIHRYRTVTISTLGGRREVPEEFREIDHDFQELRRRAHDVKNDRVVRLNRTLQRFDEKADAEGDE
jgi:hypothetical protein